MSCFGHGPSSPYHTQSMSVLTGVPDSDMEHVSIVVRHVPPRSLHSQAVLQGSGHTQETCASTEVKEVVYEGPVQGSSDLMASLDSYS